MNKAIEIYFEQTPNPESLKFVTNQVLLPELSYECKRDEDNTDFPLASSIFEKFDWASNVYVSHNFVSINKNTEDDWYELMHDVKNYLTMYIENNFAIASENFIKSQIETSAEALNDDSIEGKIKNLLTKYVKPAVERDGGNISFESFKDGVVSLKMEGSCSGCPSSQVTLKSGIEGMLKRMVPEVLEVVAYDG